VLSLAADPRIDYYIGSVHHVHTIPIDFDTAFYTRAVAASSPPTEEGLYNAYYDSQHEMLLALQPRVVGHFDLIRLMASEPDRDVRSFGDGTVWEKILRNLRLVVQQGGMLEINTSALRKGLQEPYPCRAICEEYLQLGGKLTLSDDSHGVGHLGTNYERAFAFLDTLGVTEMWTLDRAEGQSQRVGALGLKSIALEDIKKSLN
jgi:histidinol-phosphatase (PHP family)